MLMLRKSGEHGVTIVQMWLVLLRFWIIRTRSVSVGITGKKRGFGFGFKNSLNNKNYHINSITTECTYYPYLQLKSADSRGHKF